MRELIPQAAAFLALPVGNALILQGVNIVVGSTFGPAALAVFSSFRTLSRVPVQLLTMFSRSVWPEMSRTYGAGDLATLEILYRKSSRISLLGCAVICVAMYFAGPALLGLWSHDKIAMDAPLLAIFLARRWPDAHGRSSRCCLQQPIRMYDSPSGICWWRWPSSSSSRCCRHASAWKRWSPSCCCSNW
ncbi:MAG: hypothetical protein WDO12_09295 [Pseudomonadota bacterium]